MLFSYAKGFGAIFVAEPPRLNCCWKVTSPAEIKEVHLANLVVSWFVHSKHLCCFLAFPLYWTQTTINDGGSEVILEKTHLEFGHVFTLDNCLLQKRPDGNWGHDGQNPINEKVGIEKPHTSSKDLRWRKLVLKNHTPAAFINVSTGYWYFCSSVQNATWGMLSERIGRRPILLGGLAATSIVYLGLDCVTSVHGCRRGQWSWLISVGSMLLFYMRISNETVDGWNPAPVDR